MLLAAMLAQLGAFQKHALFPFTFENLIAPVNMWAISSSVSALWFSRIMALLRSFGSRQILSLRFGFFGYLSKLTQGVSSICFTMMPCQTISFSSFLISALYSIGTLCLPSCMGGTCRSILMSYSPDMSPILSKLLGYRVCRSLVQLLGVLPGST